MISSLLRSAKTALLLLRREDDAGVNQSDKSTSPTAMKDLPMLPTDVMIHIIQYVEDRELWNLLTTLNKSILQASKRLLAPWPRTIQLMEQTFFSCGKDQYGFSPDSQTLLCVSNVDSKRMNRLEVRMWNAHSGLQPRHHPHPMIQIEGSITTGRISKFHNVKISSDIRYIAVLQRFDHVPIIRVYNLLRNDGRLEFDAADYFEVVCPDDRVKNERKGTLFEFTTSNKQLVVHYSLDETNYLRIPDTGGATLMTVWDLESRGRLVQSKIFGGDGSGFVSAHMIVCTDNLLVWQQCHGWDKTFHSWHLDRGQSPAGRGVPGEDITPTFFSQRMDIVAQPIDGCAQNPIDPSVVAISGSRRSMFSYTESSNGVSSLGRDGEERLSYVGLLQLPMLDQRTTPGFLGSYRRERNARKGDSVEASLTWFPDGQHLAFISGDGKFLFVLGVDFETGRLGYPSESSSASRLWKKANEVVRRECVATSWFGRAGSRSDEKFLSRFILSPNGNILVLVFSSCGRSNGALHENDAYETTHLVSI